MSRLEVNAGGIGVPGPVHRAMVWDVIDGERDYQDKKWNENTTATAGHHTVDEFTLYMDDYMTELKHVLSRNASPTARYRGLDIMRKITAMGIACMEQNGVQYRAPQIIRNAEGRVDDHATILANIAYFTRQDILNALALAERATPAPLSPAPIAPGSFPETSYTKQTAYGWDVVSGEMNTALFGDHSAAEDFTPPAPYVKPQTDLDFFEAQGSATSRFVPREQPIRILSPAEDFTPPAPYVPPQPGEKMGPDDDDIPF
jgi:hypothetical protein